MQSQNILEAIHRGFKKVPYTRTKPPIIRSYGLSRIRTFITHHYIYQHYISRVFFYSISTIIFQKFESCIQHSAQFTHTRLGRSENMCNRRVFGNISNISILSIRYNIGAFSSKKKVIYFNANC